MRLDQNQSASLNSAGPEFLAPKSLVLGAGAIGTSWAKLLSEHGHFVYLTDPTEAVRDRAKGTFASQSNVSVMALSEIAVTKLTDANFIFECAPEKLSIKRSIIQQLEGVIGETSIFLSSSSAIPISQISGDSSFCDRCTVAHPLNPPSIVKVVEMVAGPKTSKDTQRRANELMVQLGRTPVPIKRETTGFVANRLQLALMREMASLIADDVISPKDADLLVREGLAARWAVEGPCRTLHLNRKAPFAEYMRDVRGHLAEVIGDLSIDPTLDPRGLKIISEFEDRDLPVAEFDTALRRRNEILDINLARSSRPQTQGV